uniref:Glycine N-acyltransferase-like protein n=1 Tax=Panagrellus redivivus TaxID=6233 RepID=A0A7E4WDL6_PANRE
MQAKTIKYTVNDPIQELSVTTNSANFTCSAHGCCDQIADETIEQVCDEFIELIPEFFTHGTFTISNEVLTPQISKCLSQRFPEFDFDPYLTQMFYMTKNQETEFMNSIETGIALPEEYRTKLSELPYSLVRHSPSGNAVAFEHIDAVGLLTHQFTLAEHRQKGLGAAVEMHMCRQLIALGLTPFKFVELFNVKVLQTSEKTSYWTRRNTDNGTPSVTTYLGMFNKKSQNQ